MAKHALAKVLKEKGISRYRFAQMLGIQVHNVYRLFKPTYDPKLSTLTRWSKLLGVSVKDLIKE